MKLPTRLLHAESLSTLTGVDTYLKIESELPTGSFKVRGALYALQAALTRGNIADVVAASTGNHGAAVAYAARQHGVRASIFVPVGANERKCEVIRSLGASLTLLGNDIEEARTHARRHAHSAGALLLDDATSDDIPLGAGAVADELLDQLPDVAAVYVPVGDSALIRGVATIIKRRQPSIRVIGVQAAGAPSYYLSWRERRAVPSPSNTIADGLATSDPTAANVRDILELVDDMLLVDDNALLRAIDLLYEHEQLVVEPSGAAALAAALARQPARGPIALIVSGSNIEPSLHPAVARRL